MVLLSYLGFLLWSISDVFASGKSSSQCVGILKTRLHEGLPPGRVIFKFTRRPNTIYSFNKDLLSSPALGIFQISPQGIVSNLITLNREDHRGSQFTLAVLSKRSSLHDTSKIRKSRTETNWTNACSLIVEILDANDNSPRFGEDLYVGTVEENAAPGTLVQGLQGIYATDADEGNNTVDSYKILPGSGADKFEAVTENIAGLKFLSIRTRTVLNRENVSFYVLTIQAVDGGRPRGTGETQIRINVLDVNDCSPSFKPAVYSMSVMSSTPVGTSLLKVHAEDEDSGQNREIYYFFKTRTQNLFTIDAHTGVIRVARPLDFVTGTWFDLVVVAQDRGSPPRQQQTVVKVKLLKSGWELPSVREETRGARFAKRSYWTRIREDFPVNSHIFLAKIKYLTRSTFTPVFRVLSDEVIPFEVDVNSGFLYLTKGLDYETRREYNFRLRVMIKSPDFVDEVNVTVHIDDVDENLHAPVFEKPNTMANFNPRRSVKQPYLIQELKAIDADHGISGLVKYSIRDGNGVGKFTIDENLGKLYPETGTNWDGIRQLKLLIGARDSAEIWKSSKQFVVVNVNGLEDCAPEFARSIYRATVGENLPRGTFVAVANAKDCVKGRKVTYKITAGNAKRQFVIDRDTGIIRTARPLDREHLEEHILEVTARSRHTSKAQVVVTVEDVNDNDPTFTTTDYQIQISESRGRVNNLLCLPVRDKDVGENGRVKYEIVVGNVKSLFAVDAKTGTLSSDSLNFEDQKEHTLRIRATDHGVPPRSSNTTVKVFVTNINDPPKFVADDITVVVQEERPAGSTVIFLSVTDEDEGDNGKFFCSYENIDVEEFGKFEVKTTDAGCEVQNTQILDWFGKNIYSLQVRVTDKASLRIRKSDVIRVTIEVKDINNHAPKFSQTSYWASTPENTPPTTSSILQVTATDEDSGRNAEIRYSIAAMFAINSSTMFAINSKDGFVTANRKLRIGKYKLVIYAEDEGNPKRRTQVTCYISVYPRGTSFPPISARLSTKKIAENTDINTIIARIRLRDSRHRVNYFMVGGNVRGAFKISPSGRIRVSRRLDYETVQEYRLVIRATYKPHGSPELAFEVPLKVRVLDVNDNQPSFRINNHPLVVDINKRVTKGVFITRVLAYDADSGANGTVSYDVKQGSDPVYFSIQPKSGEITATKSLDSRHRPYTFTVIAKDGGMPSKHSEYEVQVNVHKDSAPVGLPPDHGENSVNEGPSGIHTKVLTLNAYNGGENSLTYAILDGNFDDSFCIDTKGSLFSVRELDRETRSYFTLTLSADDAESSTRADFSITVNDINDNPPRFLTEPIRISTKENSQIQRVDTVRAEDADSGQNAKLRYEIVAASTKSSGSIFGIDPELGILIITSVLDREEAQEHVLTIAAQDQGSPSYRTFGRVIITVEDDNDNSPRFLSRNFTEHVQLNAPKGYPVLRTLAYDKDSGLNGEIRYTTDSTSDMFSINASTGWIQVNNTLTSGIFTFAVSATDSGIPKRSDTALVTITVDVSDGPPRFVLEGHPRGLHANVYENQRNGSVVLTVKATSKGWVTYGIYETGVEDFEIDESSGRISIARDLDFERKQQYDFMVSATDRNDRMSLAQVSISVVDVNENRPQILNRNSDKVIFCRISRRAAIDTRLVRIRARDDDKNDRLVFRLRETSDQSYFSIDSVGNIRTKASLPDARRELHIVVMVSDSGTPPLEDTVTVNVVLLNYDYKSQSLIRAEVSEATRPGTSLTLSGKVSPHEKQTVFSIVYPPESPFSIDASSGVLTLKEGLDYEKQTAYSLTVRLQGKQSYFDEDVHVAVKDENDNRPEFETTGGLEKKWVLIHKNARPETPIRRFKATDKDSGLNGEVAFRMRGRYRGLFHVGERTGELNTTGVALKQKEYNVTVEAYDKGTPSLSAQKHVMVKVDYPKPEFTKEEYQFEVYEDATAGYQVGVIEARNFGVPLSYRLRDKDSIFNINPKNGILTLVSSVDYEKSEQRVLSLTVLAQGQATSRASVIVRVRDVNDCAPKFYRPNYVDHVPESAPIGTTVLRMHALDDDFGLNADLRYSLDSEDFIIDPYTGAVTIAATLDHETKPLYTINVTAHDRGTPRLNGTAQLLLKVMDVNDNAPVFTSKKYSCSLWENAKRGSLVTTVQATDADGDKVAYDITAGNDAGIFVINPDSGVIKLNRHSAPVVGPFYLLNVSASDGVHRGHAVVNVTIKDINDHAPVFTMCDHYAPTIPEDSPLGTAVLKVSASDEDLGTNGQIEYALVHQQASSLFQIDRETGLIETTAQFDRERQRKYPLRVKAIDGDSGIKAEERLEGSCFMEVTVTDVNDNRPVFERRFYEENVKESVGIGHHVLHVKAHDRDEAENAVVSYAFKTTASLFKIDNKTGVVTTQADLMNKKKKYKLTILARDHGVPPLTAEVDLTVYVIDSDNDPPQFVHSFYEVVIPENITVGSTVVNRMIATSKNSNHAIFYNIIPGNVPATNNPKKFDIDPIKGVVRVRGHLDRETTPNYTLTIRAKNNANPPLSSSTILRISVTDVNDCAPEFTQSEYFGRIAENSEPGTSVLTVTAMDRDSGLYSETSYTMSGTNAFFDIDSETGVIRSKKKFDREKKSSYTFVVKATDRDNRAWSSHAIVVVEVTDENDLPPKFSSRNYTARIDENVPIGTEVKTVSASDGDLGLNAMVSFDITSGNDDDKFRIRPDGRVVVNDNIDYEETRKYELVLRARDGKHEDTARLTITIKNENDNNPIFVTEDGHREAWVPENSPPDTFVTKLTATDRDLGPKESEKRIKYLLSKQVVSLFRIHPVTGELTTQTALDREAKGTYQFLVYANDTERTGAVRVVVHVTDVNDNAPEFLPTSLVGTVRENMLPGTEVRKIEAKDEDDQSHGGNAVVKYSLLSDPYNAFTIDNSSAMLKTRIKLDRENISIYKIMVTATDGGVPPLSSQAEVVIHVQDENDHAPQFIKSVFQKSIPENTTVDSAVLRLEARDDDIGENAQLKFFTKKGGAFRVIPETGDIVVAKQLDYEDVMRYEFEVKVEDGKMPQDTAKVLITLEDCNDNAPEFHLSSYELTLEEGNYSNQKILTLKAEDNDSTAENKDLLYSIEPNSDPGKLFAINSKTGELFVTSSLDHESDSMHVLKIQATNTAPPHLFGQATVTITVTDINDNPPDLTNSSIHQTIFENLPEGHREIGKLQARDRDPYPNGKPFTFGIRRGNEDNLFHLDKTGELTTNATFDRENRSVYHLEVWVRDSGNPPLTNNVTVNIHVRDRNDNQHRAGLLELTVNLLAQQTISPNTSVGRVFVKDLDTEDARHYEVITENVNIFKIDRNTGDIYMKQRPRAGEYTLRVNVSDRNSSFDPVESKVRIRVNVMPAEAFAKSIALRFLNKTLEDLVGSLDECRKVIAWAINTRSENVDIFSVQSAGEEYKAVVTDVRFGAHGSPYYAPERLVALLKVKRHRLSAYDSDVVIGYDACASEPCKTDGCISSVNLTGRIQSIHDGKGKSFASVMTRTGVKCGKCEDLFPPKTTCNSRPCLNNGTCSEIRNGYLCKCPKKYRGPNCELTTRSFKRGDYVWLHPLKSCRVGNLSLEFSTLRENGVLLYNGPMTGFGRGDNYDFIAVQLHRGKVRVKVSLGEKRATTLFLGKSQKLNDGKWHLVEIFHNATSIRVVVDQCRSSVVKTSRTKDTEDRRSCEKNRVIKDTKFTVLNINEPLQIGGISSEPPDYINIRPMFYVGCIRNVRENGEMFDLKTVSNSRGSLEGCPTIDKHCQPKSPCHREAKCVPSRNTFSCICPLGYTGRLCDTKSIEQTFEPPSVIKYRLKKSFLKTYNAKFTKIEMVVRTRDEDGGVLVSIRDKEGLERLTLRITANGSDVLALVKPGDDEHVVQLRNASLGDGQWHQVSITRNRNEVHLGIDPNTKLRTTSGKSSARFISLNMDEESDIFIGSLGSESKPGDYFDGCIKDIRINGQTLPHNQSNAVSMVTQLQGVTQGCKSNACDNEQCPAGFFCYDQWRKTTCLASRCNERRCKNGANCTDHVEKGVSKFTCVCQPGFNGTYCDDGARIIMLLEDDEEINIKLVIGISCFVSVLLLATFLIICYHRYKTKGKANFDSPKKSDGANKDGGTGNKQVLVVTDRRSMNGKASTPITSPHASMYSHRPRVHTCNSGQPPAIPPRFDSLQASEADNNNLTRLPEWDIFPMIDVVLSPDSDSTIYEEFVECPEDQSEASRKDTKPRDPRYVTREFTEGGPTPLEQTSSFPRGNENPKLPAVTWNDIEEYGRKFYNAMTRNFMIKDDDTRPSSGVSTTSNSSSVVTVVENPKG